MVLIKSREGTIKWSTSAITIDNSGALDDDFSGGTTVTEAKNITITPPEGAVEQVPLIGETSGFQNAEMDEKNFTNAKAAFTLIIDGDETMDTFFGGTTGQAVSGYGTRYQIGMSTTVKTRPLIGALLLALDNGSEEANFVLNNVYPTKYGDVKLTGTDGHWEADMEFECLPKDYYWEFKT